MWRQQIDSALLKRGSVRDALEIEYFLRPAALFTAGQPAFHGFPYQCILTPAGFLSYLLKASG
jgi:hypothetical protein